MSRHHSVPSKVVLTLCLFLFILSMVPAGAGKSAPYLFARHYLIQDVFNDGERQDFFIREYLTWEGRFFALARHPKTGLSYDGFNLDERTGEPVRPRTFSAPSKECLDVALCVKALAGDRRAALVVSPGDPARAKTAAAKILEKKISGYEKYLKENPGYAGYLPWYESKDKVTPAPDWKDEFPGLDNGEWLWSMLVAERVLECRGYKALAERYGKYNNRIRGNVVKIFYDARAGHVRGDIRFKPSGEKSFSYGAAPGKRTYLNGEHGVHEGMMMVLYVCLFGRDLPPGAAERIWKGIRMKRVEHKYGTTWEAFHGSAHESWAYLILPLRDFPEYRKLFRIREIIRSRDAREKGCPGFASSCLAGRNSYIDEAGIEGINSHPVTGNRLFAIYGAFPLLLECSDKKEKKEGNFGLAWLLNMLKGDRMQGPLGGGESEANDGASFADVKTVDGSLTNVLALCGGLEKETAEMLKNEGRYGRFKEILLGEYREAFGSEPLQEPVGFALPGKEVPRGILGDYEQR